MSVVKIEEGDSVTWGAPNNIGDVNVNPESTFELINVTDETVVDSISTSGTVEKSYTPDLNAGEEADFKVKRIVQVDGNTTVTVESSNLVTIKVATTTQALLGQVNFDFGEPNYSITSGILYTMGGVSSSQTLLGQINFDFGESNYSITSGTL